jgi:ArsR family transcriptional regulator, nickel/cobalt-responsive transcriptional repressor
MPETNRHSPPGAPLGDAEAEELAQAMSAFSTRSRLKLLFALVGVERTVEELADVTGLSQTVVSQQLRVLRLLRFVMGRRTGHHVRYRLYDDHVLDLLAAIRHHGEHAATPGSVAERRASL